MTAIKGYTKYHRVADESVQRTTFAARKE